MWYYKYYNHGPAHFARPQTVDPCPTAGPGLYLAYLDADDLMFVAAPSGELHGRHECFALHSFYVEMTASIASNACGAAVEV